MFTPGCLFIICAGLGQLQISAAGVFPSISITLISCGSRVSCALTNSQSHRFNLMGVSSKASPRLSNDNSYRLSRGKNVEIILYSILKFLFFSSFFKNFGLYIMETLSMFCVCVCDVVFVYIHIFNFLFFGMGCSLFFSFDFLFIFGVSSILHMAIMSYIAFIHARQKVRSERQFIRFITLLFII